MQACSSLGYRKVIFERDNLSILKYIKEEAYSSRCQHLVNSVIAWKSQFLSSMFIVNIWLCWLISKKIYYFSDWLEIIPILPNFFFTITFVLIIINKSLLSGKNNNQFQTKTMFTNFILLTSVAISSNNLFNLSHSTI